MTFGDAFGGTPTEAVASRDGATVIAALVDGRVRVWHDLGDDQQLGANEVLDLGPISYVVDVTSSPPSVTYRPSSGDLVRWRPGPGWTLPGTTDAALEVDPQCRVRISARFCRGFSGILRFWNGSLDQLAWPPATQFLDVIDERLLLVIGGDQHRVWHDLDDDLVDDPDELSSLRLPPHHRLADLRPNYTVLTPMFDAAGAPSPTLA